MRLAFLAVVLFFLSIPSLAQTSRDPLPSWNDGAAKRSIRDFVIRVTRKGSPDFIPPAERIATFDNDGTLWAEQPFYFQLLFAFDRIKALAPQHPEWKDEEPFASIVRGDLRNALGGGLPAILKIMAQSHGGLTTDEFDASVKAWLSTARHPTTKQPFTSMVYQPMLELLTYLRSNGFKTFIVSGGGVDFMRVFAEKVYGIPPEQIVGTLGKQKFEIRDGKPVIVKLAEGDFIDDGPGKPVGIERSIGRRPIAAFGNSDGDLQMLQWTCDTKGVRLCLYVHHTDSDREWSYDRTSAVGKLDKGLDEAIAKGWVVVNMKDDWKRVFLFQKK
jgi:phosphoglycolate phosphatase-like HAD superfamily hydrolase